MPWVEILGYFGAVLTLSVYSMKRMIPLRIVGICANCVFITYGFFGAVYPQMLVHGMLLPINVYRLREMVILVRKVKAASSGDLDMEWLKPHMSRRVVKKGEIIFRKDETSSAMFYTLSGQYRLREISQDIDSGQLIGELGLIAPENKRTLTFECVEEGELLSISYDHVKQLYFQNPEFGFYFLQLTSKRLFKDIDRLQQTAANALEPGGKAPGRALGARG
jgi:CRP/FNR family cyclic AMP-dependent transcriptional regulator